MFPWPPPDCFASRESREADQLLDLCLNSAKARTASVANEAVLAAARAEAHALKSQWQEAKEEYRQAIDQIEDGTIKRSWWFNLADIAIHLDDEGQRRDALREALAVATSDDITRAQPRKSVEPARARGCARPGPRLIEGDLVLNFRLSCKSTRDGFKDDQP